MKKNGLNQLKEPQAMATMFSSIASHYDRTNLLLSLGLCKLWHRILIQQALSHPTKDYLDLCCGTGEIALHFLQGQRKKKEPLANTLLIDVAPAMLALCKKRLSPFKDETHLSFIEEDAHALSLKEESLDLITIAYGIRNLQRPEEVLRSLQKSLRKGGRILILELSRPPSSFFRLLHAIHLRLLIPFLGWLGSRKRSPYSYLTTSIEEFVSPSLLRETLHRSGLRPGQFTQLTFGSAFILEGVKR